MGLQFCVADMLYLFLLFVTDKRYHLLASIPPSLFLISSFAMMLASEM